MGTPHDLPAPPHKLCFSQELRMLAAAFAERPARVEELLAATHGRGFDLLLLVITIPFLTPIPLPGLSTPFGFVVVLIGARMALGHRPWLPERLLKHELPPRFIGRALDAASRVVRWLEVFLRPRLSFVHEQMVFRRVSGALIAISGLLLLLPLPIPLTNSFPALTVVLLAAAALERDGLAFLMGTTTFLVTLLYFALLTLGGAHVLDNLWNHGIGS